MTATSLGILVHKGLLQWDTPVHDILPEMSKSTELHAAKLNIIDILCHRTGRAWADALYLQSNNMILMGKDQCIPTFDYLTQVAPVRNKYMYNNHAYNLAGLVVERVSGQRWDAFLHENIISPLEMSRTFTRHPENDGNVAVPYNILTDRSPFRLPFCNVSGDTMMFAGQSVRASMGDMLKYSKAYLRALDDLKLLEPGAHAGKESSSNSGCLSTILPAFKARLGISATVSDEGASKTTYANSPIKEIAAIVRPQIARGVDCLLEQTYALGWNRTQLPGTLDFGWNQRVLQPFPAVGKDYPGRIAIWHGGNMPGATSALCLLPESGSAVVVLQNSLGLCDVADWVCQLILDIVFTGKPTQDYLSLVRQCVDAGVVRMNEVQSRLNKERIKGTEARSLRSYTGRYHNSIDNWFIDVKVDGNTLVFEFLGRLDERYTLRHYHYDTFVWNLSYDETVKRGQYVRSHPYYRFKFEAEPEGEKINGLRWIHDDSVPNGEFFYRSEQKHG
ncbi:uncharacterized protein ColSpa_04984 [Colletotrichum spaethianum]|uniref:Beta-lactamase/transpeptidase-like protein n=1 Tax=Colletotrichum spaethianum TaxID=700344 RepID=A0AA37LAH3_9PEZI|nr:uncharacterized protein ColSpa_04984 [Colletotrichum spaethianum]GKT44803.1 hypothetical protein ColSpa_04984 [Colletotrichum spaethianum]